MMVPTFVPPLGGHPSNPCIGEFDTSVWTPSPRFLSRPPPGMVSLLSSSFNYFLSLQKGASGLVYLFPCGPVTFFVR